MAWWRSGATGRALDLRSTGRGFKSYSRQKLRNNLGQVVHTYVPLSPSSITWYPPRGGDALQLGMQPQAWRKVMAAYRRVSERELLKYAFADRRDMSALQFPRSDPLSLSYVDCSERRR